ncbi:GntR family transcriptional regulator [Mollicutes bacterium LVI A0039]|nr:GntR family transcriptional regulator [Mollicutes bacterium LVI A0039]
MIKYKQVADKIRQQILNEEFDSNSALPIERELCETYNVSKDTMKKALSILVNEGLIYRQSGKGTFIHENIKNNQQQFLDNSLAGYSAQRQHDDNTVSTTVTYLEVIKAPQDAIKYLRITADSFVFHYERIRNLNDKNEIIEETYVPIELMPNLTETILQGSMFQYIEDDLDLKIKSAHKSIHVTKANDYEATILNINPGDPLPVTTDIIYLSTGTPIIYSLVKYNYERFNFVTMINK